MTFVYYRLYGLYSARKAFGIVFIVILTKFIISTLALPVKFKINFIKVIVMVL